MAYNYSDLRISGFEVEHILNCKIEAQMGEHTKLTLLAIGKQENTTEMVHTTDEKYPIEVFVKKEGGKKVIFSGMVTNICIHAFSDYYEMEIEAKSDTYEMDTKKHSRSFQDTSMTYHQVIKKIIAQYPHADCILEIPDKPIGELLVQYEETDWEFLKRIVSVLGEGLFPSAEQKGIHFYAGIPEIPFSNFTAKKIEMRKDLDSYYRKKAEKEGEPKESDFLIFLLNSDQIVSLGSCITINAQKLYLKKCIYELKNSVIVSYYEAQKRGGILQRKMYPMHLVGVAIEGEIVEPQKDKVKVKLDIDKEGKETPLYWFPYSTMAASTDGSGWYCMPEIEDRVRVYFPTKYTKDAIALSSVSNYDTPSSGEDRMGNPDVKYLSTIHDKELKLGPEEIRLASKGGAAVATISNTGEIALFAKKNIEVKAEETIQIQAKKKVKMTALEKIELSCDKGGKVTLDEDGNIRIKGTEVKID